MKQVFFVFVLLCLTAAPGYAQTSRLGNDVYLFEGPALKLARAVKWQSRFRMRGLVKRHPELLAYQEPTYGMTLLHWAVWNAKRHSVQALLQLGANPNVRDTYSGETPLIEAARNLKTSDYVRDLLAYGANPNLAAVPGPQMQYASPLIAAAANRLESVKLLLAAGADLNYTSKGGRTAAGEALILEKLDEAYFLIVEQKADVSQPLMPQADGTDLTATESLRFWTFPLDSPEYQKKMLIVNYLQTKGQDYWKTPIPERFYKRYSQDYLSRY